MARQSTTPVQFNKTVRTDNAVTMSSARAGKVVPVSYIPLLPGDSASGRIGIDVQLKEMPKPLLNGVHANFQAWFVPKSAFPYYSGRDELMHAMTGESINSLASGGSQSRQPPPYFYNFSGARQTTFAESEFCRVLGIHMPEPDGNVHIANSDLVDSFNLIYNFRLAAHSSRLQRRVYSVEDIEEASTLPRAFWPSSRLSRVVPDYERALIVGNLDLDVVAGRMPISGIGPWMGGTNAQESGSIEITPLEGSQDRTTQTGDMIRVGDGGSGALGVLMQDIDNYALGAPAIFAEMAQQTMSVTLADIDKARTTQAFAKLRTAYAGNDSTGFDNDDTIVSLLMQGLSVPADQFKRPWLLDNKRVAVGFAERFATDAANLDQSVTLGRASAQLSLNVPVQDVGGVIIITCEVLPERVDERMSDEWLLSTRFEDLPNALRDVQRVEPVDLVQNRRVDVAHTSPNALYGYEPMNDKWNRDFTRLGGDFYMATPGGGFTENRSNIWQTEIVDPVFSDLHYLAPADFPHDVFADQNADAFEFVARHAVSITGLTQIGDVLAENNDDYEAVRESGGGQPPLLPDQS